MIPIRFYVYVAALLLILGGIVYLHHAGYKSGKASGAALVTAYKAGASQAVAAYKAKEQAAQKAAQVITGKGTQQVETTRGETSENIRTITKYLAAAPSPAVCRANADSVRVLTGAVSAANAAAIH